MDLKSSLRVFCTLSSISVFKMGARTLVAKDRAHKCGSGSISNSLSVLNLPSKMSQFGTNLSLMSNTC